MKAGDVLKIHPGDRVIVAWMSLAGARGRTEPTAKMAWATVAEVDHAGRVVCKGRNNSLPNCSWIPEAIHFKEEDARAYLEAKVGGFIRKLEAVRAGIPNLEIRK